jgi:hypothetical protein
MFWIVSCVNWNCYNPFNGNKRSKKLIMFTWGSAKCYLDVSSYLHMHCDGLCMIPSKIFPVEMRFVGLSLTISMNYLLNFLAFETSLSKLCSFKWGVFLLFVTCVIVAQVLCCFPPWNKRSADWRNGGCVEEALVLEKVCAWRQLWKFTKETRPKFNSHGNLR